MPRKTLTPTPEQLILLRRNLTDYFSDDELRTLCSEIGVEYERLRGHGQAAKASELVRTLAARGRIPALVELAARRRPNVSWGDLPAGSTTQSSSPLAQRAGGILSWLSWLVAGLVVVVGLVYALNGGLRRGRPAIAPTPALETPVPLPMTSTPIVSTPTLAAMTATLQWTPLPPTETLPPAATKTPTQIATGTPTPTLLVWSGIPRTVTALAPVNGVCVKSLAVTFKWTGIALRPGESFLVAVTPAQVYKAKCTDNFSKGVQYSPPLMGNEWTTDLSAPSDVPPACAGLVEWTVYIRSAAASVTQAAPLQVFEWNPLRCR